MIDNDKQLLRAVQSGDKDAFQKFYDRHGPGLYLYFRAMTGSSADAEDLLQNIFVSVFKNLDRFLAAQSVKGYLFRSAENLLRSFHRSEFAAGKFSKDELLQSIGVKSPEEDPIFSGDELRLLEKSIAGLPIDERKPLLLHVYQNLSFEEMEPLLQVPKSTLYRRYQSALVKLRNDLTEK